MKKATVNDYFRHHWMKLMLFARGDATILKIRKRHCLQNGQLLTGI